MTEKNKNEARQNLYSLFTALWMEEVIDIYFGNERIDSGVIAMKKIIKRTYKQEVR